TTKQPQTGITINCGIDAVSMEIPLRTVNRLLHSHASRVNAPVPDIDSPPTINCLTHAPVNLLRETYVAARIENLGTVCNVELSAFHGGLESGTHLSGRLLDLCAQPLWSFAGLKGYPYVALLDGCCEKIGDW